MSLINQMLKDLERRRSQDHKSAGGVIPGTHRYSVASQQRSPWPFLFFIVILGLLIIVAYLLWERYQNSARPETAALTEMTKSLPVTVAKQPVSQPSLASALPPVVKASPLETQRPAKQQVKVKSLDTKVPAVVVTKKQQKRVVEKTYSKNEAGSTTESRAVTKVSRPLNPKQQSEVLYQKGYGLLASGHSHDGEQMLRKALTFYPEHVKAREVLAGLYIKAGRIIEAGDLLQEGLMRVPDHAVFAKIQARLLLDQDKTQQAIEVLEMHVPALNAQPDYHALMAAAYQRNKQHARAVAKYQAILKVTPTAGVWWIGMAISLEALGRQVEARQAYEQAKQTGRLAVDLARYTDNRLSALRESGLPSQE